MKFKIRRVSKPNYGEPDEEAPCPGAVLVDDEWWLELATLEELLAFAAEHGEVIVSNYSGDPGCFLYGPKLVIYDGYIE